MYAYIVRRILSTIPVMAVVAIFVFLLLYLTPGDPAVVIAGDYARAFQSDLKHLNVLDPTVMDARTVLKMATIGGAQAVGLEAETGSLEVGKQADVIVIDTHTPHLIPLHNPVSQMVYAARGSDVRDVIVGGNVLLRDRQLLHMDLEDVLKTVADIGAVVKTT